MDPSTWGNQVADQCLQMKVTSRLALRASSRHDRKCDAATSLSDGVAIRLTCVRNQGKVNRLFDIK
jgi:hypothetical protein